MTEVGLCECSYIYLDIWGKHECFAVEDTVMHIYLPALFLQVTLAFMDMAGEMERGDGSLSVAALLALTSLFSTWLL